MAIVVRPVCPLNDCLAYTCFYIRVSGPSIDHGWQGQLALVSECPVADERRHAREPGRGKRALALDGPRRERRRFLRSEQHRDQTAVGAPPTQARRSQRRSRPLGADAQVVIIALGPQRFGVRFRYRGRVRATGCCRTPAHAGGRRCLRVHTGVHYPADAIVGSVIGASAAETVCHLIGERGPAATAPGRSTETVSRPCARHASRHP
jgi:hypothetical protein